MIVLPFSLAVLAALFVIAKPKFGIPLSFVVRPIIDCFWNTQVAGFSPTVIMGVLFLAALFSRFIIDGIGFSKVPMAKIWLLWVYLQLFNTVLIIACGDGFIMGLNFLLRSLHGFAGYFMLQTYFKKKEDFRWLLVALLIAGILPISMSVYQNVLGGSIRTESTLGGLVRNIGFYHDAYTLRFYALQTLSAAILFWSVFVENRQVIRRGLLLVVGFVCIMTVYKLFSKAGYVILAEFVVTWNVLRKNFITLFACSLLAIASAVFVGPKLVDKLDAVYSKEIALVKGRGDLNHTFQGRWYGWKMEMREWIDSPFYLKLAGNGNSMSGSHNDFLRVLVSNGIIGFITYIVLLGTAFFKVVRRCRFERTPLDIMSLILLFMWVTDAVGLVPGSYTGYQLFVWGLIGLALGAGNSPARIEPVYYPEPLPIGGARGSSVSGEIAAV